MDDPNPVSYETVVLRPESANKVRLPFFGADCSLFILKGFEMKLTVFVRLLVTLMILSFVAAFASAPADEKAEGKSRPEAKVKAVTQKQSVPAPPAPTMSDVSYGSHQKQVLNFWKADSDEPTPLLFFIHGGGWQRGNRSSVNSLLPVMLKNGVSVVSIEYRFIAEAVAEKVEPPVKAPLLDAARALQFVRSKAGEWNIDKTRIAASGGSAGACSSLWLAFHQEHCAETGVECELVYPGAPSVQHKSVQDYLLASLKAEK